MQFEWREYSSEDAALVDSWLDSHAIHETGIEDGWQVFYDYWMDEAEKIGAHDRCFIISNQNKPFATMYLAIVGQEMTVSEYIIAPNKRSQGYGSAVIRELLDNCDELIGRQIRVAKAVIFPDNIASQKAFEKAGFKLASRHPDGDALNYEYRP